MDKLDNKDLLDKLVLLGFKVTLDSLVLLVRRVNKVKVEHRGLRDSQDSPAFLEIQVNRANQVIQANRDNQVNRVR